jgi:hypothetical protein
MPTTVIRGHHAMRQPTAASFSTWRAFRWPSVVVDGQNSLDTLLRNENDEGQKIKRGWHTHSWIHL